MMPKPGCFSSSLGCCWIVRYSEFLACAVLVRSALAEAGKVGTMVLLLAGLWLGLAGSRCSLALTVASRAGALKRLHAGALKLKAGDVLSRWQLIAFPWSLWTWRFLFRCRE